MRASRFASVTPWARLHSALLSARWTALLLLVWAGVTTGCVSPTAINSAMLSYDQSILKSENELLLLNILRARDEEPLHFTVTSSIAATFNFRVNGGLVGRMLSANPGTANNSNFLTLNLGAEASENPTATIVPVQGEEFTKRVLMPLDHLRFQFLTNQSVNLSTLFRLCVLEIQLEVGEHHESEIYRNSPGYREEYLMFRRAIRHLAYLHSTRRLYIGPITFEDQMDVPTTPGLLTMNVEQAFEGQHHVEAKGTEPGQRLRHPVTGRTIITNVPPDQLTNEERAELNRQASQLRRNAIPVLIRPDGPGGEFPLIGKIRLRSFSQIIKFLANGLVKEPEYTVPLDEGLGIIVGPFGELVQEPPATFTLESGTSVPSHALVSTTFKDRSYWINGISPEHSGRDQDRWNREVFSLLYQIYQLTVSESVTKTAGPAITIAK